MKKLTKLLSIILAMLLCFGTLPLAAFAAAPIASGGFGKYGSGSWVIDANGNLTISGEVGLLNSYNGAPWYEYKDSIKTASFASGSYAKEGASLSYMFYYCESLTSLDLSNLDTSSVKYMEFMFEGCKSLTSLDLSSFDTSSVEYMYYMFRNCLSLTSLDLSSFDTSSVKDMHHMFSDCESLTSLDLSNFDTSSVTDMRFMFYRCTSLTSLDLSNFNTSSVTDMEYMFYNCESLTSLDLSSFDTSSVRKFSCMFCLCKSLTSLDLSSFDTYYATNINNMFTDCGKATNGLPAICIVRDLSVASDFRNYTTGINANNLVISVIKKIENIEITGVTPPVIGATASFDYKIPRNCKYEISTAFWAETEGYPNNLDYFTHNSVIYHEGDNLKFEAGKYYTFVVTARPIFGFEFDNNISATVNNISSRTGKGNGYIGVWRFFGKPVDELAKSLSSISVTTQPAKTTYIAGQSFDKSGMVVKANYSDGTSATISNYTVTDGNNLSTGKTSVTISYTEDGVTKTTTVAITVTGNISTPTPTVAIKNNPGTKTINYGEGVKFTAIATNLPEGAVIKWYVNGAEKGTGTTFTFSDAKSDTTVTVKVVDKNGNVIKDASNGEISASEKITVKAGFFQKLISFFKNLFKANRIIAQAVVSDK